MKSASTYPLIVVRGVKSIPNSTRLILHFVTLPEVSTLDGTYFIDWLVITTTRWAWKYGHNLRVAIIKA